MVMGHKGRSKRPCPGCRAFTPHVQGDGGGVCQRCGANTDPSGWPCIALGLVLAAVVVSVRLLVWAVRHGTG